MTMKLKERPDNKSIDLKKLSQEIRSFVEGCLKDSSQFKFSKKKCEELLRRVEPESVEYLFLSILAETLYFIESPFFEKGKDKDMVMEQTRWQHKIIKLLACNPDPNLARCFWSNFNSIVESYKRHCCAQIKPEQQERLCRDMIGIRQGLIGEIGFYRALKILGLKPEISDVEDDVNAGVDFVVKTSATQNLFETLIQIKYTRQGNEIKIYDATDPKTLAKLQPESAAIEKTGDIYDRLRRALEILGQVCSERTTKRPDIKFRGLVVVIPVGFFDEITAEPRKEKLPFIRRALAKYFPEFEGSN